MSIENKRIKNSLIIFVICLVVHSVEVFAIRTDETIFAECFMNKMFGVVLLFIVLHMLGKKWRDIGFVRERFLTDCLKGFGLCALFYAIGFAVEFAIFSMQGNPAHMEFFVTGFSLTGNVVKQTGVVFVSTFVWHLASGDTASERGRWGNEHGHFCCNEHWLRYSVCAYGH